MKSLPLQMLYLVRDREVHPSRIFQRLPTLQQYSESVLDDDQDLLHPFLHDFLDQLFVHNMSAQGDWGRQRRQGPKMAIPGSVGPFSEVRRQHKPVAALRRKSEQTIFNLNLVYAKKTYLPRKT